MEKPLLLIIGRTASGKDTLAQALCKKGLSQVLSYTTRPRRAGEEDTHIFIQPSQVDNYPNKMAYTEINGYVYFTTDEDINNKDIYIIDPKGVDFLLNNPQFTRDYVLLYLDEPENVRQQRFMARDNSSQLAFQSRNEAEAPQFKDFERYVNDGVVQDTLRTIPMHTRTYLFHRCETADIVTFITNKGWH